MRPRWLKRTPQQLRIKELKEEWDTEIALHMATLQKLSEEKAKNLQLTRELEAAQKTCNKAHEELERANRLIEVLTESKEVAEPTINEQRKYVINAAKVYVIINATPAITFEVDAKARKVAATVQSDKCGIGKIRCHLTCRDDQVFNEHIFKAVTLANLLQQHTSAENFMNAVRPNFAIGQIVTLTMPYDWERFEIIAYDKHDRWKLNNPLENEQWPEVEENLTILDDTNAIY